MGGGDAHSGVGYFLWPVEKDYILVEFTQVKAIHSSGRQIAFHGDCLDKGLCSREKLVAVRLDDQMFPRDGVYVQSLQVAYQNRTTSKHTWSGKFLTVWAWVVCANKAVRRSNISRSTCPRGFCPVEDAVVSIYRWNSLHNMCQALYLTNRPLDRRPYWERVLIAASMCLQWSYK